MPIIPQIVLGAYLLFLVAAGWRLWTVAWSVRIKAVTALALVLPMPLLFILPAMQHRGDPWSDLLLQLGLTLLVCGIICVAGGFSAARLRARRRK
ncbi:hypothetical protein SAMN05518849_105202 [Sphingobium sp. AP50]|uniref:hypothetical protein n=1 Tax=Sphingobium sp. AP50 TaxID=1884369 RepID=UPI0008C68E4F|nr:hypothetical protein [Sphingobium sp. AP50]SEJ36118.1 hypothetical protein SAMN05518849_105202 [Sphingobium sp. AP50]